MTDLAETLRRVVESSARPVTIDEARSRSALHSVRPPPRWPILVGLIGVILVSTSVGVGLRYATRSRNQVQTAAPSTSPNTHGSLNSTHVQFRRSTNQGVNIVFELTTDAPIIDRVRQRLRDESEFEVREGRQPVPAICFPTAAYSTEASQDPVSFRDNEAVTLGAAPVPEGDVNVVRAPDKTLSLAVMTVRTTDPAVASLEFDSYGLRDRQETVKGWAVLALIIPDATLSSGEVVGTLVSRGDDGTILTRVELPRTGPAASACSVPVSGS